MFRLLYSLLLILILTACTSPAAPLTPTPAPTPAPPAPWQVVGVFSVSQNVMAAGFLTEDYGITVGTYPGLPYFTTDGGETWTPGVMQADCRYGLDIVDASIAWASGGAMNVRRTTDGGSNWPPVSDYGLGTTKSFHTISFLDDTTGWVASLYMFGSTTDGGATWTDVQLPTGLDDIASIDLVAPATGYLLDFSGNLFFTADNGSNWTYLSRLDLAGLVIPKATYQMAAMRFSVSGDGIIVVSEEYRQGKVMAFHTYDGGRTWISEEIAVTSGPLFLSRSEPLLTVLNGADIFTLLRYSPMKTNSLLVSGSFARGVSKGRKQ
jgi:photosystem II stability/assembly factor-like uncharacterized protein